MEYGIPIEGYNGKYTVSKEGVVWKHINGVSSVVPALPTRGIYYVGLYNNITKKQNHLVLARLVAHYHISPIPDKSLVEYADGDSANTHVENLRVVSSADWSKVHNNSEKRKQTIQTNRLVKTAKLIEEGCEHGNKFNSLSDGELLLLLKAYNIPEEYANIHWTVEHSPLLTWQMHQKLFSMIDTGQYTNKEIGKQCGLDYSSVSRARSGNRLQEARKAYDKFIKGLK